MDIEPQNQAAKASYARAALLFAGSVALLFFSLYVVGTDYTETRATAKDAYSQSGSNTQAIGTITKTQSDLLALHKETQKALREVELEQARQQVRTP